MSPISRREYIKANSHSDRRVRQSVDPDVFQIKATVARAPSSGSNTYTGAARGQRPNARRQYIDAAGTHCTGDGMDEAQAFVCGEIKMMPIIASIDMTTFANARAEFR